MEPTIYAGDRVLVRDPVPAALAMVLRVPPGHPVPDGRFLAVGDNPDYSADSRYHGYYEGSRLLGVVSRPMR